MGREFSIWGFYHGFADPIEVRSNNGEAIAGNNLAGFHRIRLESREPTKFRIKLSTYALGPDNVPRPNGPVINDYSPPENSPAVTAFKIELDGPDAKKIRVEYKCHMSRVGQTTKTEFFPGPDGWCGQTSKNDLQICDLTIKLT